MTNISKSFECVEQCAEKTPLVSILVFDKNEIWNFEIHTNFEIHKNNEFKIVFEKNWKTLVWARRQWLWLRGFHGGRTEKRDLFGFWSLWIFFRFSINWMCYKCFDIATHIHVLSSKIFWKRTWNVCVETVLEMCRLKLYLKKCVRWNCTWNVCVETDVEICVLKLYLKYASWNGT